MLLMFGKTDLAKLKRKRAKLVGKQISNYVFRLFRLISNVPLNLEGKFTAAAARRD